MKRKAFTLIEFTIVIALIGIIALFATQMNFNKQTAREKKEKMTNEISTILNKERTNAIIGKGVIVGGKMVNYDHSKILLSSGSLSVVYYDASDNIIGTGTSLDSPFFGDKEYRFYPGNFRNGFGDTFSGKVLEIKFNSSSNTITLSGTDTNDNKINDLTSFDLVTGYQKEMKKIYFDARSGKVETKEYYAAAPNTSPFFCTALPDNLKNNANVVLTYGSPVFANQAWAKDATSCGFSCLSGFSGNDCSIPPTCKSFSYTPIEACRSDGKQAISAIGFPLGCTGGNPLSEQTCSNGTPSCKPQPNYPHASFDEGIPTQVDQAWIKDAMSCSYTCNSGFTGIDCSQAECSSFTYIYDDCVNGKKSISQAIGSPAGCTGGNPQTEPVDCSVGTPSCKPQPNYPHATDFREGNPSIPDQDWLKDAVNCGYSCQTGYTGTDCNTQAQCTFTYDYGVCQPDGTQQLTEISRSPAGCVGTPLSSQACTYNPPTCTSFTYTPTQACQSNGTQTVSSVGSPAGCIGGNPVTTIACVYTPLMCTTFTYTPTQTCQAPTDPMATTGKRTVSSVGSPVGCTGGSPDTIQSCGEVYSSPGYYGPVEVSDGCGGTTTSVDFISGCNPGETLLATYPTINKEVTTEGWIDQCQGGMVDDGCGNQVWSDCAITGYTGTIVQTISSPNPSPYRCFNPS